MTSNVKKISSPKNLTEALKRVKPVKTLDAKKHLGKVRWPENPLEYQKRIRDEWD
jgi:hypothetical protein